MKYPEKFSLSYNETRYSNEKETCRFIEEILQPYIKKVIERENLPVDQKSLVIMDVFKGQVTNMNLFMDEYNHGCIQRSGNQCRGCTSFCKHNEFSSAIRFDS